MAEDEQAFETLSYAMEHTGHVEQQQVEEIKSEQHCPAEYVEIQNSATTTTSTTIAVSASDTMDDSAAGNVVGDILLQLMQCSEQQNACNFIQEEQQNAEQTPLDSSIDDKVSYFYFFNSFPTWDENCSTK